MRRAIATVLGAISRNPRDWARLKARVSGFAYLNREDEDGRTLGKWEPDRKEVVRLSPQPDDPATWGRPDPYYVAPGNVRLSRRAPRLGARDLAAVVAHECGHAVTREAEFEKRESCGDAEWASELCADWHAFKWGFEAEIRHQARRRSIAHHAVLPGETLSQEWEEDGVVVSHVYKVDRNFYLRLVRKDLIGAANAS